MTDGGDLIKQGGLWTEQGLEQEPGGEVSLEDRRRIRVSEGSVCDSWPCWNDGTCLPNGTKNFTCHCTELYTGDRCQLQVGLVFQLKR